MELFISNNNRFTLVLFKPISDHTVRWLAIISIQWRRISVLILICIKLLNSMDTQKMETKRSCQLKSFSLITCKLVSRKKLFTIKIYIKSRLHYNDINAYQRITRVSTWIEGRGENKTFIHIQSEPHFPHIWGLRW